MSIPNKKELQQIASSHSSDIGFKDFMKLYKGYTKESYSFYTLSSLSLYIVIVHYTLSSDNPLQFRKKLV